MFNENKFNEFKYEFNGFKYEFNEFKYEFNEFFIRLDYEREWDSVENWEMKWKKTALLSLIENTSEKHMKSCWKEVVVIPFDISLFIYFGLCIAVRLLLF